MTALKKLAEQLSGTSRATQRVRLRAAFHQFPMLNTVEIRTGLDIIHPAGRVQELREEGINIVTLWTMIESEAREKHRVANYLLIREAVHAGSPC
jgi:hypothetical protein